jgi:uridine kinase
VYKHTALKSLVEPLLRQIRPGTPEYLEAERLPAFLDWFLPAPIEFIPDNSILREFVGGSSLKDFKLWAMDAVVGPSLILTDWLE